MRIAVTGATGLVGGRAAQVAVEAGHEVVALSRPSVGRRSRLRLGTHEVEQRTVELTDEPGLVRAMAGCDGLLHCAAVYAFGPGRAEEVERTNREGTRAVLQAAAAAGVRRAVVTSSAVTCGSSTVPLARTERHRLGGEPAPAYYASKVAQEEVALETSERAGIPVVLALPTLVLGGPFGRLGPSNAIVLRYLLDPSRSTYPGGGNVVDARDVGAGHLLLLEHGVAGERYLLGGHDLTWRALHTLVADLTGLPGPYAELPTAAAWAAAGAAELWARLTGGEPQSTREEASTIGRFYWYVSGRAEALGYAARPARATVAASLAWLAISPDLPRWVREGLRFDPEVRAARPLLPAPLGASPVGVSRSPRRRPRCSPRHPR